MTRKDYELIARALNEARPDIPGHEGNVQTREAHHTVDLAARNFADELQRDNPRFNRARFLTACGIE